MGNPLVRFEKVTKAFGDKVILDNVDLAIQPGDAVALIGPSGTGKTTILQMIGGLIAPDSGEVWIEDCQRRGTLEEGEGSLGVGMVFQQNALFDSMTVYENAGFFLERNSSLPKSKICDYVKQKLEMVGLGKEGDRYPSELSGGMQKRVSIARALVSDPEDANLANKVLLYDEPTAGLDPVAATHVETLMRELMCTNGGYRACAVVTHRDNTIRNVSNRIIFLYDGKIQWDGPTREAYESDHPLLKQFFSASVEGPIP